MRTTPAPRAGRSRGAVEALDARTARPARVCTWAMCRCLARRAFRTPRAPAAQGGEGAVVVGGTGPPSSHRVTSMRDVRLALITNSQSGGLRQERDSNPRQTAYEAVALPTELTCWWLKPQPGAVRARAIPCGSTSAPGGLTEPAPLRRPDFDLVLEPHRGGSESSSSIESTRSPPKRRDPGWRRPTGVSVRASGGCRLASPRENTGANASAVHNREAPRRRSPRASTRTSRAPGSARG